MQGRQVRKRGPSHVVIDLHWDVKLPGPLQRFHRALKRAGYSPEGIVDLWAGSFQADPHSGHSKVSESSDDVPGQGRCDAWRDSARQSDLAGVGDELIEILSFHGIS